MSKALEGIQVVVTRPRDQVFEFVQLLNNVGAATIEVPTVAITDPDDGGASLREHLANLSSYQWCVFTSVNTVERVFSQLDAVAVHGVAIAAIGSGTAHALEERGVFVELVPPEFVAESLVEVFPEATSSSQRVLLPRAAQARDTLPEGLAHKGWCVDVAVADETIPLTISDERKSACSQADVITFTSPSAVRSFAAQLPLSELSAPIAVIGPITAEAVREYGRDPEICAEPHNLNGLISAMSTWVKRRG